MDSNQEKILIVDDVFKNSELLVALLKLEGYRCMTAKSGEEALEIVSRNPPDLILLDVMMPDMDGYHVANKIKADPSTKNIPIIMVTSLNDRNSKLRGLDAGAEDFLTKPVDRAELWVRVRNLLRMKKNHDLLAKSNLLLKQQLQNGS
jgi:DNA-binding response OmpR family regulator